MKTHTHTHTHTPGPWIARQVGGSHVSIEKTSHGIRSVIAETYYFKLAEEHGGSYSANAQIIAAAPEMLAALCALLDAVTDSRLHGPEIEQACAAIAKAEGNA